ncbi:IclR family transcriptional regulator [Haloarchaeobius sp. HME9146]|uniref:IclR family transcriptional regulator n=1 Tax=Haloarchaeobius sp. HME9146 TaxID=2978732 RepID=UPI0021C1C3E0|nr:IclR family transcriptional regulator [Haloarchaeobius sp. HME9146]MCT9098059.1 IclR family transcriptional regulator [Haloarchaeobius sp. HME9146]
MGDEANRPIKSLLTMDEMVAVLDETGGARVTEVADELDRPQSVVHDYLSTLRQLGYVVKNGPRYRLSLRFLELGSKERSRKPLYDIAKPEIDRLADESSSELVSLVVEEDGKAVCLAAAWSSQSIQYNTFPGMHFHLHSSATGKAMLAHLPEERVHEILDRHGMPERTPNTVTDRDELFDQFELIRERGLSYEREEYKLGMMSYAAPVTADDGQVLGAISVSGPAHRMREDEVEDELTNKLLSAINIVELNYGAR